MISNDVKVKLNKTKIMLKIGGDAYRFFFLLGDLQQHFHDFAVNEQLVKQVNI